MPIRTIKQTYDVVEHINARLPIGGTFEVGGDFITKVDDREFTVRGPSVKGSNQFMGCELGEFVIWPNRKAWNAAIKAANKGDN